MRWCASLRKDCCIVNTVIVNLRNLMELFKKQALLCGYCALSIQVLYTSMKFKHHSVALMETNRESINFPDSYYQIKLLSHGTC